MDATAILIAVAIGVLCGATSSLVTRRLGVKQGVVLAVIFSIVALSLLAVVDLGAVLLLAVVDLGAVLTALLAFTVTAAIFDPRRGAAKTATS